MARAGGAGAGASQMAHVFDRLDLGVRLLDSMNTATLGAQATKNKRAGPDLGRFIVRFLSSAVCLRRV